MRKRFRLLGFLSLAVVVIALLFPVTGAMAHDDTPPTVSGAFTPADNATGVAINTNLVINFNENVQKSSSHDHDNAHSIQVKKSSDGTT
jgi:methionine-rich copper-binding protein CopC